MDKLELDARMARVERRVSFLFGLAILWMVVMGLGTGLAILRGRAVAADQGARMAAVMAAQARPAAVQEAAVEMPVTGGTPGYLYDNPFGTGGMGMQGPIGQSLQQLLTIRQLLQENAITAADWEAKKAQLLAEPIVGGDLRVDLQAVQQLWQAKAINDAERDALKQQLLGLSRAGEAPAQAADAVGEAVAN